MNEQATRNRQQATEREARTIASSLLPIASLSRPVRCPACGAWCELVPTGRHSKLVLVDPGVGALAPSTQHVVGRHQCTHTQLNPRRPA